MQHTPTFAVMLATPMYVFLSFSTNALGGMWERIVGTPEPPPAPITLSFVGDMMFDRYIREKANLNGYDAILRDVHPTLQQSTLVFGNLEGPITTFTPVADYRDSGPNHYRFTFATTVAQTLRSANFSAVTLSNNHTGNFGTEGLEQTTQWLDQAGVGYVGGPTDPYTPWRTATSGHDIAVYAYDPWNLPEDEILLTRIQAEATSTFVILLAHWGEEYETVPNKSQRDLARAFIDAGVDFIAGSHPHVIQNKEKYQDAWIYYSLGNFVFDQYFSAQVRCGAVVTLTLDTNHTYSVAESFIQLAENGTTIQSDCKTEVASIQQ